MERCYPNKQNNKQVCFYRMQFRIYFIHLSIFALLRSCAKETLKQKERNYAKV